MKTVCVITGGGSGMGFETARILGRENNIIICGRTVKKLQGAIKRFGDPKDIAELLAFVAGPKPGYLMGVDILMDGGCVSGRKLKAQD